MAAAVCSGAGRERVAALIWATCARTLPEKTAVLITARSPKTLYRRN